jgi:hypothetical protein
MGRSSVYRLGFLLFDKDILCHNGYYGLGIRLCALGRGFYFGLSRCELDIPVAIFIQDESNVFVGPLELQKPADFPNTEHDFIQRAQKRLARGKLTLEATSFLSQQSDDLGCMPEPVQMTAILSSALMQRTEMAKPSALSWAFFPATGAYPVKL